MGRVREERRREEERRSEKRKSQKKEDAGARKGRKVAKHCVFRMICGSRGSESRLAKATGAEPSGQIRNEKLHVVVAQSTFGSQNVHSSSFNYNQQHYTTLHYTTSNYTTLHYNYSYNYNYNYITLR